MESISTSIADGNGYGAPTASSPHLARSRGDRLWNLAPRELDLLFSGSLERDVPAGAVLFTPSVTGQRLFFLKAGRVDLYRLTPGGKRLVTRQVGPGGVFGVMALLGKGIHQNFAEAVEDSVVQVLTVPDARKSLTANPILTVKLLESLSARLMDLETRFLEVAYSPVEERVAHLLLAYADPSTEVIDCTTHREIADTVGAMRPTVSEVLASFSRRGWIRTGYRSISIVNREALQGIVVPPRVSPKYNR